MYKLNTHIHIYIYIYNTHIYIYIYICMYTHHVICSLQDSTPVEGGGGDEGPLYMYIYIYIYDILPYLYSNMLYYILFDSILLHVTFYPTLYSTPV